MTDQDIMLFGIEREAPEVVPGRAGPVSFEFTDLMLRHVRIGDVEIARRVYFGLRPADWDVVYPIEVRDMKVDAKSRTFKASWTAHCKRHDTDYEWSGKIVGKSDGTIAFSAAGTVLDAFQSPRIGLNVLLAGDHCAGAMFEATGVQMSQGPIRYHEFTRKIPRTQIVSEIDSIRFCPAAGVAPGMDTTWSFTGSNTDVEDQRNWAESTYKIFAALKHTYPDLPAGQKCEQTVTLSFPRGTGGTRNRKRPSSNVKLKVGGRIKDGAVPCLGVDLHPDDGALSDDELKLVAAMGLEHLRVRATDADNAIAAAKATNCALGVIVDDASDASIDAVRKIQASGVKIAGLDCVNLDAESLAALRAADLELMIGGPAVRDFGHRPALRTAIDAGPDFLSWGVQPNHHQDDDQTYLENSRGVKAQIETANYYYPEGKLVISGVDFEATYPRPRPDARQAGLLAAAYAAGVIKCVAEGGVAAATFYRAAGTHGVIHRKIEHPLPAYDGDDAPQVYPAYHVLKLAAALQGETVREVSTTDVVRAEAMATDSIVMLVNKSTQPQDVEVSGLRGATGASVRTIGTSTFDAIRNGAPPAAQDVWLERSRLVMTLEPCAVVFAELK